jgi:NAD(P)H-dependent flavin oxidoreductase YrpB (nitropropane dioxygenase family)
MAHPTIIQGGMGVAVSSWRLARAVSRAGHLGVVSGTAVATILVRRLQRGDADGSVRRALGRFPAPQVARRILDAYFVEGGKPDGAPYRAHPMPAWPASRALNELTAAACFVEVSLAKEGHDGLVGINLLEKVQLVTLPSLLGALLAGVDYVLMGAGIPRAIPGILDRLARGERADLKLTVDGALPGEEFLATLDPREVCGGEPPPLRRPCFLAIVASSTLATTLARKSSGRVDGFVIEGETAGGHNAPPRGPLQLSRGGEPVYGPRDVPDLDAFRELGLPFWLAGSYGRRGGLAAAQRLGAVGIQVGTAFAFCEESGLDPELKRTVLAMSRSGEARVFTDPLASPTGFPFKVVQVPGSVADAARYDARPRVCDLGYLRQPYRRDDGTVGYRCPGEDVDDYVRKGGRPEDTRGRRCVCNGLVASVGFPQVRSDGTAEPALVTAGNDVTSIAGFLPSDAETYGALDVIRAL